MSDDLTARASELVAKILDKCSLSFERDAAEELTAAALRSERKRALEEAERVCREYSAELAEAYGFAEEASTAESCADRIAGLERGE